MVNQADIMALAIAVQDYEKQKANYHFNNWELAELERCEREIKGVIGKYSTNISSLIELIQNVPGAQKFIPEQLNQRIQEYSNQDEMGEYYSYDGQRFSSMKEAIARNTFLENEMNSSKNL